MTEQVSNVSDLAGLLLNDGNEPEPQSMESTGATEEVLEPQTEEVDSFELEADSDGIEEDAEESEVSEEPEYFNVKVGGEDMQVTLEEALSGYQRDSDYRQKTMATAEERKKVEARGAEIDSKLQELDSFIKREEDSTDWDALRRDDPGEYLRRKEGLETIKEASKTAQSERDQELSAQRQEVVTAESQRLAEIMGGDTWSNEQRNMDLEGAVATLKDFGVTEAEMPNIVDHRMWRIAIELSKAQKLKTVKSKVHEQIRTAPKSVKPGQKVAPSERKRANAAKKLEGSNKHNAASVLADYLNTI